MDTIKNRVTNAQKATEMAKKVLRGYTHICYHSKSIINGSQFVTLNFIAKRKYSDSDDFEIVPITIPLSEYMKISNERKEIK